MSGFERYFRKVTHPVSSRYNQWLERKRDQRDAEMEFIMANRGNPDALARAGFIPPRDKPFHAKEYYEDRGNDLFLEKVLCDPKKRKWF